MPDLTTRVNIVIGGDSSDAKQAIKEVSQEVNRMAATSTKSASSNPQLNSSRTSIQFKFNDWGTYPNTFLTLKGKDVLGKSNDPKDGVIGASVTVIP